MKTLFTAATLALASLAFTQTTFGPGAGGPIANATNNNHAGSAGQTFSDITVAMSGFRVVSLNSVTITNLNHTSVGDLSFALTHSQSGATVMLHDTEGFAPANLNGTYTFVVNQNLSTMVDASQGMSTSQTMASGSYAAYDTDLGRSSFSQFGNIDPNGVWTLSIIDWAGEDTGTFGSWSFNATVAAVPEPASMLVISLGLTVLARRRRK